MAVKKETTAKKATAKKTVAKTTAPKKTTTVKKAVVKKEVAPKVAKKTTNKKGNKKLPGGFLMVLFLIVAAVAAIVTIIGTVLEYRMDVIGSKLSEDLVLFISQCKDASIGIFGIFIVLALFVGFTRKK